MNIIQSIAEMQAFSETARMQGKKIAFVPTMGFLHAGHLFLIRHGRSLADVLIVSIFVNPIQFGPAEDFNRYPRDWDRDVQLCKSGGVDVIFSPKAEDMYPESFQTEVSVPLLSKNLCGISRPGHFQGVATVVVKLFNCTKPHVAIFGEKDFQQLAVIKRLVQDLNFDIQIIGIPTVREADGLAMSSRNTYLTEQERRSAASLSQALFKAQELFQNGERDARILIQAAETIITRQKNVSIDYIKICDIQTLQDVNTIAQAAVMALAVKIGTARLIDNVVLKE
jgi:pantoate--beta-alanine ligase